MLPPELQSYLDEVRELPDFANVDRNDTGISMRSVLGDTPLHVAAVRGEVRIIELLLDAGAEIDARGEGGHTPLQEAAGQGHEKAVRLLLSKQADTEIQNEWGLTAAQIAKAAGKRKIAALLASLS